MEMKLLARSILDDKTSIFSTLILAIILKG